MHAEHQCRIVRDAHELAGYAMYWDGAYCDSYPTTRSARAAGLSMCALARHLVSVVISVEDARGRRVSTERLLREPLAA